MSTRRVRVSKPKKCTSNVISLVVVMLGLTLAVITFILLINKRNLDEKDRDTIQVEKDILNQAIINIQESLVLEYYITSQKDVIEKLELEYANLKDNITKDTQELTLIDPLNNELQSVNDTITLSESNYTSQINTLEEMFYNMLSISTNTSGTSLIYSGLCILQGLTGTTITYDYKKIELDGMVYYYYVINPTTSDISFDNTGFRLESCAPSIYTSPQSGVRSPIFIKQMDSIHSDDKSVILDMESGNNRLWFKTTSFVGTRTMGITTALTHFISFF